MQILNLDPTFKPFGEGLPINLFEFPSGCEPHIKIAPLKGVDPDGITVTCRIKSSSDIITLLLAVDALKRMGVRNLELFIPYLPFARQDRVMVEGEPLSVKVMADLINSCGFEKVTIYDPHSEVCLALINNSEAYSNHNFVKRVLLGKSHYYIVSPDAGAYKKIFKLCQSINYTDRIALCNKTRNVATGEILSITCDVEDFMRKDVYIVDDICDGGFTFILLANELRDRNCGKINLVVSHGIFSKGYDLKNIDHIYTTDSFKDIPTTNNLTQIKHGLFS